MVSFGFQGCCTLFCALILLFVGSACGDEKPKEPGSVTIHRLNRTEYNNTVRDLLKTQRSPADLFPDDDKGYGFDNIASVLTMSPLLFVKLERSAEELAGDVFRNSIYPKKVFRVEAESLGLPSDHEESEYGEVYENFGRVLGSENITTSFGLDQSGVYIVTVRLAGVQTGPDPLRARISVGGDGHEFVVAADIAAPAFYQVVVPLEGADGELVVAEHAIELAFLNESTPPVDGQEQELLVDWIRVDGPYYEETTVQHIEVEDLLEQGIESLQGPFAELSSNVDLTVPLSIETGGAYDITLRAYATSPDEDLPFVRLAMDQEEVAVFQVSESHSAIAKEYTYRVQLDEGNRTFQFQMLDSEGELDGEDPRAVYVDFLRVIGPMENVEQSLNQDDILVCSPVEEPEMDCVRQIITAFGRRAWRRPLESHEIDRLVALYEFSKEQGADFEQGVQSLIQAMLLSPHFLYRVELDPDPSDPTPHELSPYELATRLSYALWSTMPDEELFARADDGTLGQSEVLREEVVRMLDDKRALALVINFAGQWLNIRDLDLVKRDRTRFPVFSKVLVENMRLETQLLFEHFLHGGLNFSDFWASGFTFVNQRLATFYGFEGQFGSGMEMVSTEDSIRVGLLTHASILTATSPPVHTAPPRRGNWVLGKLLCAEQPPPPEGATLLVTGEGLTVKEQFAQVRQNPNCAGCHVLMDPLGISLENFDTLGQWRDEYGDVPVEAFEYLPDGSILSGAEGATNYVQEHPGTMPCFVEHFFAYMIGRGVETDDQGELESILKNWKSADYELHSLIELLVESDAFRMRQAPPLEEEN